MLFCSKFCKVGKYIWGVVYMRDGTDGRKKREWMIKQKRKPLSFRGTFAGLSGLQLIKKRFFCYECQIFKTIIYSVGHETIYFEKYLRTAASENLSDAAILIFRRYFRSSSLQAFCKESVLKTSVKFLGKHICSFQ